jgi:photosystem II stability/assembly factor-like uncharacterized protein
LSTFGLPSAGAADGANADPEGITWLVRYDGTALPEAPWMAAGPVEAKIEDGALHLAGNAKGTGHYQASWHAEPGQEIIVEAKVKVGTMTGSQKKKTSLSLWPWRDGAPVMVQVSDGQHQEGLALFPTQATSFTDRFIPMDTVARPRTYRLIIRGTDMAMWVDGVQKVTGQNAFWKPAGSHEPFIRFGSTAKVATGDAFWTSVKLGVRPAAGAPLPNPIKIHMSEPWDIPREDVKQTRPYLYDMGQGLLLMSVGQSSDYFYEPYGVLKSTDAGKTWAPIPGLDYIDTAPLPMLRRPDGAILGASRWTYLQPDGSLHGWRVVLDATASTFTMDESRIVLPARYASATKNDQVICERHIWNDADGGVTMALWSRKMVKLPDGRNSTERWTHLMKSTDGGRTWSYFSTVGPGGEPAIVRLSSTEMTAVIRGDRDSQMKQTFSHDGGKTWGAPVALEVGKVCPDLVLMSNGVLACSYGRPASCVMFSVDGGKTWPSHYVISDRVNFNYTSIREISPGRLLYVHDAPKMNAVYIDVER